MSVSVLMAIFLVELGKPVPERTRSVFHWSYKDDGGGGDYWSYKTCQTVTTNTTQLLYVGCYFWRQTNNVRALNGEVSKY